MMFPFKYLRKHFKKISENVFVVLKEIIDVIGENINKAIDYTHRGKG